MLVAACSAAIAYVRTGVDHENGARRGPLLHVDWRACRGGREDKSSLGPPETQMDELRRCFGPALPK